MRFGMVAAAAAALVCAGQADAARYFEFEIKGSTTVTFYDGLTGRSSDSRVDTVIRATYDTAVFNPEGYRTFITNETLTLTAGLSRLFTTGSPGLTSLDLTFSPSAIAVGGTLQTLTPTGTFGFLNCPRGFCSFVPGTVTSFSARTSDTAPAVLGGSETLSFTAVPEPATWALMIVGMGAMGYVSRRRRAKAAIAA